MAQQALEKHVKALLLQFGVFDDPKKLGHMPLYMIMEKVESVLKNTRGVDRTVFPRLSDSDEIIKVCSDELRSIKKYSVKIAWWKRSLGISLSTEEEKKIRGGDAHAKMSMRVKYVDGVLRSQLQQERRRLRVKYAKQKTRVKNNSIRTTPHAKRLSDKDLEHQINNKHDGMDYKTLAGSADCMKGAIEERVYSKYYNQEGNLQQFKLDRLVYYSITQKQEKDRRELRHFVVCLVCMRYADEITLTLPHLQFGRYPYKVDGKKTASIYKERRKELRSLVKRVRETCASLECFSSDLKRSWS